jgi:hypothetical protein
MKRYLLFLAAAVALAQAPNSRLAFGPWTSTQSTFAFDNRQIGNFYFVLTYQAQNCSALTLTFQSASGVYSPGSMGTYTGTVNSGSNPSTNTSGGTVTFQGFVSWYGVAVSGLAGSGCSVSGVVNGFTTGAPIGGQVTSSGCPGTLGTPCVVDGVDSPASAPTVPPVSIGVFDGTNVRRPLSDSAGRQVTQGGAAAGSALAGNPFVQAQSDGTNAQNVITCPNTAIFSTSTSGNTQIIPLSGTKKIYICKMTFSTAGAVNVQLTQGAGSNCGTGTTNLGGQYQAAGAAIVGDDFAADNSYLVSTAGAATCINLSGSVLVTGQANYAQF